MTSLTRPLALVTGASSGIGVDLARELARDGHDLVLSARTVPPMERLAAELEADGAASVVIPADLSKPGGAAALVGAIEARGLTVEVLINNAGIGAVGRFDRMDPVRIGEMLEVNIMALTDLTRMILHRRHRDDALPGPHRDQFLRGRRKQRIGVLQQCRAPRYERGYSGPPRLSRAQIRTPGRDHRSAQPDRGTRWPLRTAPDFAAGNKGTDLAAVRGRQVFTQRKELPALAFTARLRRTR